MAAQQIFESIPFAGHPAARGTFKHAEGSQSKNTTEQQGFRLNDLPEEISSLVIDHLSPRDLTQVRLVSKKWNAIAARCLFRTLAVLPTADSEQRFRSIVSNERLATLVKNIKLYTFKIPDIRAADCHSGSDYGDSDAGEDFWSDEESDQEENDTEIKRSNTEFAKFLIDLKQLPNFGAIAIVFTEDCRGVEVDLDMDGGFFVEQIQGRRRKLCRIFEVFQRSGVYPRSLTIKNLQNHPDETVTANAGFQATLQKLEELHIQMTEEYHEHGPDQDIEFQELRTFNPHLRAEWIEPISNKLTSLSLYNVNNWGVLPGYLDMTGLNMPSLRTLALGNYTFGHDDQVDWILNQTSLQELVLHNCMVVYLIDILDEYMGAWSVSTRDWEELHGPNQEEERCQAFKYAGTWATIFGKIREALPGLRSFKFDHLERYEDLDICNTASVGVWLSPRRYVFFDSGTCPSRWLGPDRSGRLTPEWWWCHKLVSSNRHEETRDEDARALWELVTTVERRVRI
ncbi:hypothetical protein K461DRAFT_267945 [Myriangium duriaei CBS 260.36]|uniref:F-box domain-containing protein n=1 Tax=Myriangium duriaei CBS 260.36 TaxID=1168546 RepID=A0A9P4MKP3_9PEZI|nr:hypothetical protein K461DRAFT_267945 [Myriangium duriaei CBS 260.36]